jgi:hypothetical protein
MDEFRQAIWEEVRGMVDPKHREVLLIVLMDLWSERPLVVADIARALGVPGPPLAYATVHNRLEAALIELGNRLQRRPEISDCLEEMGLSPTVVVDGIVGRLLRVDSEPCQLLAD